MKDDIYRLHPALPGFAFQWDWEPLSKWPDYDDEEKQLVQWDEWKVVPVQVIAIIRLRDPQDFIAETHALAVSADAVVEELFEGMRRGIEQDYGFIVIGGHEDVRRVEASKIFAECFRAHRDHGRKIAS